MFKVGDIVKYAPGWFAPGEEKYLFVVREIRDHRDDPDLRVCRYLIGCLNSCISDLLPMPTEVVDEEMITLVKEVQQWETQHMTKPTQRASTSS